MILVIKNSFFIITLDEKIIIHYDVFKYGDVYFLFYEVNLLTFKGSSSKYFSYL